MKFLKEADKAVVKTIDAKIKNKWSWKWCSEPVINVIPKVGTVRYQLQDCIAKIDLAGFAWCHWCNDKVS